MATGAPADHSLMKLALAAIALSILAGLLAGGRFSNLAASTIRWPGLAGAGLALQVAPVPGRLLPMIRSRSLASSTGSARMSGADTGVAPERARRPPRLTSTLYELAVAIPVMALVGWSVVRDHHASATPMLLVWAISIGVVDLMP